MMKKACGTILVAQVVAIEDNKVRVGANSLVQDDGEVVAIEDNSVGRRHRSRDDERHHGQRRSRDGERHRHRSRDDEDTDTAPATGKDTDTVGIYESVMAKDEQGNDLPFINMHDGPIHNYDGVYYWYGMQYGECTMNYATGPRKDEFWLFYKLGMKFAPDTSGYCSSMLFETDEQSKESRCGFWTAAENQFPAVYQSDDLRTWTQVAEQFRGFNGGAIANFEKFVPSYLHDIYFRPQVVYNKNTKKYVMWLNRIPSSQYSSVVKAYVEGNFLVATSNDPRGPFTVIQDQPTAVWSGAADFALLESDGKAFNAYGSWSNFGKNHTSSGKTPMDQMGKEGNLKSSWWPLFPDVDEASTSSGHVIAVQELNDDFTGFLNDQVVDVTPKDHEAPLFFTRRDPTTNTSFYYLLAGTLCCFCAEGSNLHLWMTTDPTKAWFDTGLDINPRGGKKINGRQQVNLPFQSNYMAMVKTSDARAMNATVDPNLDDMQYMLTGDMWHTGRNNSFPVKAEREKKGMDFQHWEVIQWENTWLPGAKEILGQESVLVPKVLNGAYPDPALATGTDTNTDPATGIDTAAAIKDAAFEAANAAIQDI